MRAGRASHRGRGSSPHTRGARQLLIVHRRILRIIPAYAGSTLLVLRVRRSRRDHPRIRGEHGDDPAGHVDLPGSSPHTRGARGRVVPGRPVGRIIPAYAGSTWNPDASGKERQDHPRIRGEHRLRASSSVLRRGSSPHTRGALEAPSGGPDRMGIIPAYAGSTPSASRIQEIRRDHPRIRGEHG